MEWAAKYLVDFYGYYRPEYVLDRKDILTETHLVICQVLERSKASGLTLFLGNPKMQLGGPGFSFGRPEYAAVWEKYGRFFPNSSIDVAYGAGFLLRGWTIDKTYNPGWGLSPFSPFC